MQRRRWPHPVVPTFPNPAPVTFHDAVALSSVLDHLPVTREEGVWGCRLSSEDTVDSSSTSPPPSQYIVQAQALEPDRPKFETQLHHLLCIMY